MADHAPKVTERLAAELAERPSDDAVAVVIELQPPDVPADSPGASRAELISARRDAFEAWSASVTDHLREVGGELVDGAWINSTLKGTVPAQRVEELAQDEKIEQIDTPSTLVAE